MKSLSKILKMANTFHSLMKELIIQAENENHDDTFYSLAISADETMAEKTERDRKRQNAKNWEKKIIEIGKTNPNDPRYVKLMARRKEYEDTTKMLRQEDPEFAKEYKAKNYERFQRFEANESPEHKAERFRQRRQQEIKTRMELINSGSLQGLCKKLKMQLANVKSMLNKQEQTDRLAEFEKTIPAIVNFINLCSLVNLSTDKQNIMTAIRAGKPALSAAEKVGKATYNTTKIILNTVQKMADDFNKGKV